jgi:ABC-type branched-subunit amino acid transport system ATPase component
MSEYSVKRPLKRPPVHPGEIKECLKECGLTVLLVEPNQAVALWLDDRGYVIDNVTICYHDTRRVRAEDVIR